MSYMSYIKFKIHVFKNKIITITKLLNFQDPYLIF